MEKSLFDLKKLLWPITVQDFMDHYLDKQPLLIKRDNAKYFEELFNLKTVSTYLERNDLPLNGMRLVKDGQQLDAELYAKTIVMNKKSHLDLADSDQLFKLMADGAT